MKKILFAAIMLLAPLTMSAQKFGHFNSAEVVQLMPEYNAAQTELQNLAKQYEDDFKRMQDEFQKKSEEFEKEQANLLDNVRAVRPSYRISTSVSSRPIGTTSKPCRRHRLKSCRPSPRKSLKPSRRSAMKEDMYISWISHPVFLTSAPS